MSLNHVTELFRFIYLKPWLLRFLELSLGTVAEAKFDDDDYIEDSVVLYPSKICCSVVFSFIFFLQFSLLQWWFFTAHTYSNRILDEVNFFLQLVLLQLSRKMTFNTGKVSAWQGKIGFVIIAVTDRVLACYMELVSRKATGRFADCRNETWMKSKLYYK